MYKSVKLKFKRKRKFLTKIFEREKRSMMMHLQGKKKLKKSLQKFQSMKQHNLEKIMDDYFFGVCYQYYKRQMRVWILLQHKYLRSSAVNINDRRFLFTDLIGGDSGDKDTIDSKQSASFPIYFTTNESEEILNMTQDIQNKIEFLTRGTSEAAPVGALADNVSLPTNYPADESDSGPDEPAPPKISKFISSSTKSKIDIHRFHQRNKWLFLRSQKHIIYCALVASLLFRSTQGQQDRQHALNKSITVAIGARDILKHRGQGCGGERRRRKKDCHNSQQCEV